jgi:hypothetical protein
VQRAVDLAEACVVTLEGQLDDTRRRCDFADRSTARFAEPLASAQAAADHQTLELELLRPDGTTCLRLRAAPAEPGRPGVVEGAIGALRLAQEIWVGAPNDGGLADARTPRDGASRDARAAHVDGGDAGTPDGVTPARVRMTCGGEVHERTGADLCARCGDAGCPALLGLRARVGSFVELRLEAGARMTPLFTCRPGAGGP